MLMPRPLVSKHEVLRAFRPTDAPSDSVLRRLRDEGIISEGIKIRPRRGGRLSGTITAYYALNEDAAIAYRRGDMRLARRARNLAEKAENGRAAKALVALGANESTEAHGFSPDLEGLYGWATQHDRRPLDELAARAMRERTQLDPKLVGLGVILLLAVIVELKNDTAELASESGERFSVPRTPELQRLAQAGLPVSVRVEQLAAGGLLTMLEPAWSSDPATAAPRADDPFSDLRPAMPRNLAQRLRDAPLRPLALTGPSVRWT